MKAIIMMTMRMTMRMMTMRKAMMMGAALALLPWCACANTWTDSSTGITWTYSVNGGAVTIGSGSQSAIATSTQGAITIPSQIKNLPVTSIGNCAFYGCSRLTSVTIPSGVTRIGEEAFEYCRNLSNVLIPTSVTSIENSAFGECNSLKNVTIPEGVKSIGKDAFSCCRGLTNISLSASVTNIGELAFFACQKMEAFRVADGNANYRSENRLLIEKNKGVLLAGINGDVVIPSGVTSIGWVSFRGCSGLKSIKIPESVTNICDGAFSECTGLTRVIIPSRVKNIGYGAFTGCSGLKSITFSSNVMRIGDVAFVYCSGLKKIVFNGNAPVVGNSAFENIGKNCVVYVRRESMGWGVKIPGTWQGMAIRYSDDNGRNSCSE